MVDAEGKLLVVYHGTFAEFVTFDPTKRSFTEGGMELEAAGVRPFFFTSSREIATEFGGEGGRVVDAYLSLQNPLVIEVDGRNWHEFTEQIMEAAKGGVYDGVILKNVEDTLFGDVEEPVSDVYAAFEPTQIKSATGNRGTFDPTDPRMSYALPEGSEPVVTLTGDNSAATATSARCVGRRTSGTPTTWSARPPRPPMESRCCSTAPAARRRSPVPRTPWRCAPSRRSGRSGS